MRTTHNTIRAMAISVGLTLLVVTGTAAMMAIFANTSPATDTYRSASTTPAHEPANRVATAYDSVLYERALLADGSTQWVLTQEPVSSLAVIAKRDKATNSDKSKGDVSSAQGMTVSYTLAVKPSGLSKSIRNCSRSTFDAYDIACNSIS